jgi:predicted ATPase
MRISRLRIENFRSIRNLDIELGDKDLFREAKTFLHFLRQDQALRELEDTGSGSEISS